MEKNIIKILLIDRKINNVKLIQQLLNESQIIIFSLSYADTPEAAIEMNRNDRHDAIIYNIEMQFEQSINSIINIVENFPECPVILLTESKDENIILQSLKLGVQDCIFKNSINSKSLIASIRNSNERMTLKQNIINLNRIYSIISNVNQAIVRIKDKKTLLKEICNITVTSGDFNSCIIILFDDKNNDFFSSGRWPEQFSNKLQINKQLLLFLATNEITLKDYLVYNSILDFKNVDQKLFESFLKIKAQSFIVYPIKKFDKFCGAVFFISNFENSFNESEKKLLLDLSQDISFSLEFFEIDFNRQQTLIQLNENEKRFREILENVKLIAAMIDVNAKIIFANDFLLNLTGWKRNEIIGKNWFDIFAPMEKNNEQEIIKNIKTQNVKIHEELEILTKNKNVLLISWNQTINRDANGNIIGVTRIGEDVTEIRKTISELRNQNALIKAMFECSTQVHIFVLDKQFNFIDFNEVCRIRFEKIYKNKLKIGMNFFDFINNDSVKTISENQFRRVINGESINIILQYPGTDIFNEYFMNPIWLNENEVIGLTCFITEVTERIKTNQQIIDNEEKIRKQLNDLTIISKSSSIILESDILDNIISTLAKTVIELSGADYLVISERNEVNGLFKIIYFHGLNKFITKISNILGKNLMQMEFEMNEENRPLTTLKSLPEDSNPIFTLTAGKIPKTLSKTIQRLLNLGDIYTMGFIYKDELYGSINFGIKKGNKLENNGLIEAIVNQASLAISRLKTQISLVKSEEKYKLLIENAYDGIFLLEEKNLIYVNPRFCQITGYLKEEILNPKFIFLNLFTKEYKNLLKSYYDSNQNNKQIPTEFEAKLINRNGREVVVNINVISLKEPNKLYTIGFLQDITEKNKLINEIIAAKEKAEEMNTAKSVILANMSHELRTPMAGILGFSQILLEDAINEDTKSLAQMINISGRRMMKSINQILELSIIESGDMKINLKEINLNSELKDILELYSTSIKEKNLKIHNTFNPKKINFNSDPKMLNDILNNLISNAIKFNVENGKIYINLNLNGQNNLTIEIVDTGIGISQEHLLIIFEEFRHVSEGIARSLEGIGLGLTITRKYIEILGGTINVTSKIDEGSKFTVFLPKLINLGV